MTDLIVTMLKVHFLNVGHGECTLIEHHSGHLTMVDINTSHEYDWNTQQEIAADAQTKGSTFLGSALVEVEAKLELTDPIEFLQSHYPNRSLFRFVLTHPDLDHMRGLKRLRETVGFTNFWDVQHNKTTPKFRGDNDREEWNHYQQLRSKTFALKPRLYKRGNEYYAFARDNNQLGNGDGIEILSPTDGLVASCNAAEKSNDLSYVLRLRHAGKSVLLTGDIEDEAWTDIAAHYKGSLKTDYLQASHHGRDSGFHAAALRLIDPAVVIVSVGRKPSTDARSKYKTVCQNVWSTRYYGNITLHMHGDGKHEWFVERNAD